MIYFIQSVNGTGPIKIGFAINPDKRFAEIQRMSPVKLKLLTFIDGNKKRETYLHRHFSHLREHGEWFTATPELMEFINCPVSVLPILKGGQLGFSGTMETSECYPDTKISIAPDCLAGQ